MPRVIHHDPDWPQFVGDGWAERIFTEPVTDRFHAKQGRSIGRWTLTAADGRTLVVYLKRHFQLPWIDGLFARVWPWRAWSPGLQEWEHLRTAAKAGVPVPRAVAVGEFRGPGAKLRSFLAVEELAGMLPLHEAIPLAFARLPADEFHWWKRGLIAEMARLTRLLHRRRLFHRDLYLCHFYIAESDTGLSPGGWAGRVVMIDFHRLTRSRWRWPWATAKDLGQLLYSTFDVPGITDVDRARFWKRYRAGDWGNVTVPPGWVKRLSRWKGRRYYGHNVKRLNPSPLGERGRGEGDSSSAPVLIPPHPQPLTPRGEGGEQ